MDSVLRQEVPAGYALEVVIGVSDPSRRDDVATANAIAAREARVRVALGPGRGAAATRNAAVTVASGSLLAFIDDDCEAQPGWLNNSLEVLADADIVQGRTRPAADVPPYHHSISVDPPSWLWETCNLCIRRPWLERVGGFNENWNRAGRQGNLFQFGEDAELGWRMVRDGARPAFAPNAVVHHRVLPRTRAAYLAYKAGIRRFPQLLRSTPEVRRIFYLSYFVNSRHVVLTASTAAALLALAAPVAGRRRASRGLIFLAAAGLALPAWRQLAEGDVEGAVRLLAQQLPDDLVEFGGAVYGSMRWRRLLL